MCRREDYLECEASTRIVTLEKVQDKMGDDIKDHVRILNEKMDKVKNALTGFSLSIAGAVIAGIILFVLGKGK